MTLELDKTFGALNANKTSSCMKKISDKLSQAVDEAQFWRQHSCDSFKGSCCGVCVSYFDECECNTNKIEKQENPNGVVFVLSSPPQQKTNSKDIERLL